MSPKEKDETHRSKPVATIGKLALDHTAIGSEYDGMRGTAWGWLNSVTEYVDHSARAKNADRRFDSAYFGKGADLKAAAFEYAKAYAPSMSDLISSINKMAPKPAKNDSGDTALLDRDDDDSVY
jgi:hypothetical protein